MNYLELFIELDKAHVRYLICGGLAMNIYGIPRMTADIDLLLDLEKENLKKFEIVLKKIGYQTALPISISELWKTELVDQLQKEKNLIAFSFYDGKNNLMSIDVLLTCPIPFKEMEKRKVIRQLNNHQIYLTSIDDLIKMKEAANRNQDITDVQNLIRLKSML